MAVQTAPAAVDAAKADSVAAYLAYRTHQEGCWRSHRGLFCMNCEVLEVNSSAADWRLARERELAKGLAA